MNKTYYLFQNNKVVRPLANDSCKPLTRQDWDAIKADLPTIILFPLNAEGSQLAAELPEDYALPERYSKLPLRRMIGFMGDEHFSQWSKAAQLTHWYRTQQFCGHCGSANELNGDELSLVCPNCHQYHYPVISPCIITLIHQQDSVLLGRSPRFPKKLFSTLAGFIEPGETAEQAVHREIFEEVGVLVNNITYFTSQPWPFPSQLMLGFFAEYKSGAISIDGDEICEADWFSLDNLPNHPPAETLSGQLIRDYLKRMGR